MVTNGDTVWVVKALGGTYPEDIWEGVVGVFPTEQEANDVKDEFDKWHYNIDDNPRLEELGDELCDTIYYDLTEYNTTSTYIFHGSSVHHVNKEFLKKYNVTDEDVSLIQLSYLNQCKNYDPCVVTKYTIGKCSPN